MSSVSSKLDEDEVVVSPCRFGEIVTVATYARNGDAGIVGIAYDAGYADSMGCG